MKFIKSLFTDGEWDGDLVKVLGFSLVVTAVLVWIFMGRDPTIMLAFGSALAASGKFSKQG